MKKYWLRIKTKTLDVRNVATFLFTSRFLDINNLCNLFCKPFKNYSKVIFNTLHERIGKCKQTQKKITLYKPSWRRMNLWSLNCVQMSFVFLWNLDRVQNPVGASNGHWNLLMKKNNGARGETWTTVVRGCLEGHGKVAKNRN